MSEKRRSKTGNRRWAILAVAVATAILAIAIGTYLVLRGPSPASAVTAYVAAIEHGDYEAAYAELSEAARRSVGGPAGLRQTAIGAAFATGVADSYEIGSAKKEAGRTSVEVKLVKVTTETVVRVSVVREGGHWRVEI